MKVIGYLFSLNFASLKAATLGLKLININPDINEIHPSNNFTTRH